MTDPFSLVDSAGHMLGLGRGMTALLTLVAAAVLGGALTLLMAGQPAKAVGTGAFGGVFVGVLWVFGRATAALAGG